MFRLLLALTLAFACGITQAAEFPTFKHQVIDPYCGEVCYAVTLADVDGDELVPADRDTAAGDVAGDRIYAFFFLVSAEEDPGQHLRLLAQVAGRLGYDV